MRSDAPALLLIAHGTRHPRGAREMAELLGHLRSRLRAPVEHGWLEGFAEPGVAEAVERLVAQGVTRIVSVPFLNLGAGHAKTGVPNLLAQARRAQPQVTIAHGRVLGLHRLLFELAGRRVDAVSPRGGRAGEALVVTASGSSDPDANADLAKVARFLAEWTGHRWVDYAFSGVTWPTPDVALRRLGAAGAGRVVLFSWSLLAGLLEQRASETAARVGLETGLEVVDAGRLGPDPLVAEVVLDRYREVLHGDPRMNCDLCAYRV
ncbi:MAG: sirohydrochlorin chelatase, partial [Actinomycetota bacterium]|nr:sirohydrochlorin chelatase [Actinomycetota bacterium]